MEGISSDCTLTIADSDNGLPDYEIRAYMFCYARVTDTAIKIPCRYFVQKKKITERKNRPESEDGSGTEVLEMLFRDRWLIGRCILATVTARK